MTQSMQNTQANTYLVMSVQHVMAAITITLPLLPISLYQVHPPKV